MRVGGHSEVPLCEHMEPRLLLSTTVFSEGFEEAVPGVTAFDQSQEPTWDELNGDGKADSGDLAHWQQAYDPLGTSGGEAGDVRALSTVVFFEDFEGIFPGAWWRNSSQSRQWDDTNYKAASGSWSAHCAENLDDSSTNTYVNDMDTWMSHTVDLTAVGTATLQFDYWLNSEPGYDYFKVGASKPGSSFSFSLSGNEKTWLPYELSLNDVVGHEATISFQFTSDSSVVPAGDAGVWVDNVVVTAEKMADFNYDGKVDSSDLAIWQQHYDPLGSPSNTYEMGDANRDEKIDSADLALWQQYYDPLGSAGGDVGALAVVWPSAPLVPSETLYVNQNGKAILSRSLTAANEIDAYEVFFKLSGNMTAQTTGTTDTEMAFYDGWGPPDITDDDGGTGMNARIDTGVLKWDLYTLAVAGHNGLATGPYGLSVVGPAAPVEVVPVSVYNLGRADSSVDEEHDFKFFRFTTTVGGDWTVRVSTDSGLDPMLVIYDNAGNPVGGSYTLPIDYNGAGGSESWNGTALAKNATYYVRVDGFAGSTGSFHLDITGPVVPVVPRQTWSTYVGGGDYDYTGAVATDGSSNTIVVGKTQSSGWTVGGYDTTYAGALDAFAVKIDPDGQHVWSAYIGDTGADAARAVATDSADNIYVVGETFSSGWVSGGWITTYGGGADGFVLKLDANGNPLWSSYLGGGNWDAAYSVTVDPADNVIITGYTQSDGWVSDGWDDSHNGGIDGFAAKLSSNGVHMWSTYLGGANDDSANGVTTDSTGAVLVGGETSSSGWVAGGYDTVLGGTHPVTAGFIVKLTTTGGHVWSTYVGGDDYDKIYSIDADVDGSVVTALWTRSSGWVRGRYDDTYGGNDDGALVKVSAAGGHLWSTYVGGADYDEAAGAAVDRFGNAVGVGGTETSGWPSGGFDTSINGSRDPWVAQLRPDGTHGWSSYLGGSSFDGAFSVATDPHSEIAVGGDTTSSSWTSGGYDTTFNGWKDVYVVKIRVRRAVEGDANGDGKVDSADLAAWQSNYDPLGSDPDNDWESADFNGDGKVDSADLALWQQNYDPVGSSDSGAVALRGASETDTGEAMAEYSVSHSLRVAGEVAMGTREWRGGPPAFLPGVTSSETDGRPVLPSPSNSGHRDRAGGAIGRAEVSGEELMDILTLAGLDISLGA